MAVPQCNHIDGYRNHCSNDAQFRCTGPYCGNKVYCVEHSRMIDSAYICDNCLKEIERANREAARKREEAERASREAARRFTQEMALARELALAEARKNSKILYPRIMFLLSVVLICVLLFIAIPNSSPNNSTPLIVVNPTLAYIGGGSGILGLIFLGIAWIWCLYFTYKRDQPGWRTALWFTPFSAAIPLLLYVLIDPIE